MPKDEKIILPESVQKEIDQENKTTTDKPESFSDRSVESENIILESSEADKNLQTDDVKIITPDEPVIHTDTPPEKNIKHNTEDTLNKAHVEKESIRPERTETQKIIPPEPPTHAGIHSSFSHGGEKKDLVYIVYILYILGYVTGIANLIGVVLAYMVKDTDQPLTYSHYQEQIKIFWISLIGFIVGLLTVHIFLGILILIFTYVWVIVKTIKGLLLLNKDKPFPKGEIL